jgi:hypothetical protein
VKTKRGCAAAELLTIVAPAARFDHHRRFNFYFWSQYVYEHHIKQ